MRFENDNFANAAVLRKSYFEYKSGPKSPTISFQPETEATLKNYVLCHFISRTCYGTTNQRVL